MEKNNHPGNGFINGFLLGAFVGGIFVFLLGTEKGKKLLKVIMEEGLESISSLEDVWEEEQKEGLKKPVKKITEKIIDSPLVKNHKKDIEHVENSVEKAVEKISSNSRRFFKGVRRKK